MQSYSYQNLKMTYDTHIIDVFCMKNNLECFVRYPFVKFNKKQNYFYK